LDTAAYKQAYKEANCRCMNSHREVAAFRHLRDNINLQPDDGSLAPNYAAHDNEILLI